jgi:hypothetical protein
MVKPYLSRLRPAESGRPRPRPRSRFEPTPRFPIDGPAIGPDLPPKWDAPAADAEIELDRDAPYPHPAGPAPTQAAPGEQGLPPARTAAPEPAARDTGRTPGRAARPADPPPQGPPVIAATTSESHRPASAGNERADLPTSSAGAGGERTRAPSSTAQRPAPWSATQQPAPWPRHAPPEQAPVLGDRAGGRRGAEPISSEPTPRERPPLAPHRHLDRASNPADAPADRVQAMARWLRDMDAETAAEPSISPRSAAMDPEVTVTIGRIEVKVPAVNPARARPQPSGPRRRVPSLGDYLESRTRTRGRPG